MELSIDMDLIAPRQHPPVASQKMVFSPSEDSALKASDKWSAETVLSVRTWTPALISLRTSRYRGFRFTPGQFARIGIPGADGAIAWRPYSIASVARDEHLEFFFATLPGSAFTSRLARLRPGDRILVEMLSYGDLTTDSFVGGKDLWMLSSGTGLAPFLSILRDPTVWKQYDHLIVAHSVRQANELAYGDEITALARNETPSGGRAQLHYIPIVTRECCPGALCARITQLIEDGRLEARAGVPFDLEKSRIMVCGNLEMTRNLRQLLVGRGFRVSHRGELGNLALESY